MTSPVTGGSVSRAVRPSSFALDAVHASRSPTMRFHEFYFSTFRPWMAVVVLLGWIGAAIVFRRLRDARITAAALYSFLAFVPIGLFYLRIQSLTSRYVCDFAASLVFASISFLLIAFQLLRKNPWASAALSASSSTRMRPASGRGRRARR